MELDNIIYIIIAIVLAIVNAVAQKKKKAAKEAAPKNIFEEQDQSDEYSESAEPIFTNNFFEKITEKDPIQVLLENDSLEDGPILDEIAEEGESALEPISQLTDYEKRMQEKANELLAVNKEANTFDYDEESIASSAIGDALTEEEEYEKQLESRSSALKDFKAREAIIYSEIIKPKYFSSGVNN